MTRLVSVVLAALAVAVFCLPDTTMAQVPGYQPPGVSPGETYHLAFVSSVGQVGYIDNIADYNNWVDVLASASTYNDINTVPGTWKAILSTIPDGSGPGEAYTNAPVSGDVYRVDGVQVSDEDTAKSLYQDPNDFHGILAPIAIGEDGADYSAETSWGGSLLDGRRRVGDEMGAADEYASVGQPGKTNEEWLDRTAIGHVTQIYSNTYRIYALSEPLHGYDPSGLAGDFDGDGDVDGQDFLLWQRDPDGGNLGDWEANFGTVTASAANSAAVPEPGAIVCLVVGLMALVGVMRQKRPVA